MSSMTRTSTRIFSKKDLQSAMTRRDRTGDYVKVWDREYRERVNKWGLPLLSFIDASASDLDRYKTKCELNKAQEQADIDSVFSAMLLGISMNSNYISLSLKNIRNII